MISSRQEYNRKLHFIYFSIIKFDNRFIPRSINKIYEVAYCNNIKNTPAATAEPTTPATFGPMAAIIGLTLPSVS